MNAETLAALRKAAQAKGHPLSDSERAAIVTGAGRTREYWRTRFIAVIRGAGYLNDAPERICDKHLDGYLSNIPEFEAMLVSYETNGYDPD